MTFGNNDTTEVKGYSSITNVEFAIQKVVYAEGLKHNLISVSGLLVRTRFRCRLMKRDR